MIIVADCFLFFFFFACWREKGVRNLTSLGVASPWMHRRQSQAPYVIGSCIKDPGVVLYRLQSL